MTGDFLPVPHPAAVCVVRFMLGFEPETGSAASAHPRVRNLGWVQSPGPEGCQIPRKKRT